MVAARQLEVMSDAIGVTVADARWMKPLDTELVEQLAREHDVLITIEEGSIGGFGDHVLHHLALNGFLDEGNLKVRPMVLPDTYIEAASMEQQYEQAGLNDKFIVSTALKLLGRQEPAAGELSAKLL